MFNLEDRKVSLETAPAIASAVTDQAVSREFRISGEGSSRFRLEVACSGVAITGAITAKLQTYSNAKAAWIDAKTVAITGNDTFQISLNPEVAGDQGFLPLRPRGRLVITTTNALDTVTVDGVWVYQAT